MTPRLRLIAITVDALLDDPDLGLMAVYRYLALTGLTGAEVFDVLTWVNRRRDHRARFTAELDHSDDVVSMTLDATPEILDRLLSR